MFEITIKETTTTRKLVRGAWLVVEKRPYTNKELSESNSWFADKEEAKKEIKDIMGYAPDREQDVTSEREILKQSVDDLDLAAVIRAVNKL